MTCITNTKSNRHLPATLAAGVAISAFLALGVFVSSANADEHRGGGHAAYYGEGHRGGYGGGYGGWDGGYYGAPPVVYGAPYYYSPPVIYGPGIGIALPGIGVSIY